MNASKEEAKKAKIHLSQLRVEIVSGSVNSKRLDFLYQFLVAAERKLPSEKSYEREKQRKRTKAE